MAKVVTPEEVEKFFDGKNSRVKKSDDGGILVSSKKFELEFAVQDYRYRVKIWSSEDESDADEAVTKEPAKFIAKFLGADIPGGEHFEKMSSSPSGLSAALRRVASDIESGELSGRDMLRVLRRAAVAAGAPIGSLEAVFGHMARRASKEEILDEEIGKLESDMKGKGWKVERGETDYGHPKVHVDISGIYEADVTMEAIKYKYYFSLVPSSLGVEEQGETDDPIAETRRFVNSKAVSEAVRQRDLESSPGHEQTEGYGETEPAPSRDGETKPPPSDEQVTKRPPPRDERTRPSPS